MKDATANINRDKDTKEFRVRLFIDGVYQAGADYYTDDLEDARETAKHMVANAKPSDKSTEIAAWEQDEYENDKKEGRV